MLGPKCYRRDSFQAYIAARQPPAEPPREQQSRAETAARAQQHNRLLAEVRSRRQKVQH